MGADQLGLLLWKNYVVRKRRPAILGLVFLWPIVIFMLLYTVRDNVVPEYNPTCQFPARLMPRDGLLPFVQSYICSVGNPCESLDNYEEIPSYKNAKLGPLMMEFQSILPNKTVLSAVETLPQSIKFVRSMGEILTKPEIKKLFDRGIRLGDLFNNHEILKKSLMNELPNVRENLIDDLFDTSIKLLYLIESFGSMDIESVVCTPNYLKEFIIVSDENNLFEISKLLCNIDSNQIPILLEKLSKNLDFTGFLEIISRIMAKFSNYDIINDIKNTAITILNLETLQKYIPKYLKLRQWIPDFITLFKNVDFKKIDLTFINKIIKKLDVVFNDDDNWPIGRSGLEKFNDLLKIVNEIIQRNETKIDNFEISQNSNKNVKIFQNKILKIEDITEILDASYKILLDGVKLTKKLLDHHVDEIELSAQVFDGLKNIFPKKIMNTMTYFIAMMDNIVRMTHHVAIIHDELQERIYNISKKHEKIVNIILIELEPKFYQNFIETILELGVVEKLIEKIGKENAADIFCTPENLKKILKINDSEKNLKIHNLICSKNGKNFINDIYDSLEIPNFKKNIENTLNTFITMAFSQPVSIEKSNLTTTVKNIKLLMNYFDNLPLINIDWSDFKLTNEWKNIFNNTMPDARKAILLYHLSVAKLIGITSFSYAKIKPDLENMDIIADVILNDLNENPKNWISEIRKHKSELLESFYLTVTDRSKTLKILEYSNFTNSYCFINNTPELINYPKRSNVTLLKQLICRLSRTLQKELEMNITTLEVEKMTFKDRKTFNWTLFNGKIVEIYGYIDNLIQFNDNDEYYRNNYNNLMKNFKISWTDELTIENGWEIIIGLLTKFFELAESPLFNIQSNQEWNRIYAIAWSVSTISDKIERILDDILKFNNTAKLSNILIEMPETEILFDSILRNLPSLTIDLINIFNRKNPIYYITIIKNHQNNEPNWPCKYKQSIGDAMEFNSGTKQVIKQIEKIMCNPELFLKEWNENPTFLRVYKIFSSGEPGQVPEFNWTSGYISFRGIVNKFILLLNSSTTNIILSDKQNFKINSSELIPDIKKIIDDNKPKIEEKAKNFFDYLDIEINKNIDIFQSNMTIEDAWMTKDKKRGINEILVITKFGSKVLHDLVKLVTEIVEKSEITKKLNILNLMGFTSKSVVSIVRDRFPYILATLIYGISDPALDHHIYEAIDNNSGITCSKIFTWFSDYKVGLTDEEYRNIKNFTCDQDPLYFNSYFDLYLEQAALWKRPIKEYKLYFFTLASDFYDFSKIIQNLIDKKMKIIPPIDENYLNNSINELKNILQVPRVLTSISETRKPESNWTIYRLIIEGISEALKNSALLLKENKFDNNLLHLWDLVKPGDVHQLIKYIENHPTETLGLAATLGTFNSSNNNSLINFNELKHKMCNLQFDMDFWKKSNNTYFLKNLCTYDPYQLLTSATSENYFDIIIGKSMSLEKIDPLSKSLTKFLDNLLKIKMNNKLIFKSNLFNFTTWKNLPNDTKKLIYNSEKSWVHKMIVELLPLEHEFSVKTFTEIDLTKIRNMFQDHPLNSIRQILELSESWMDIISGGDIWQKLKTKLDNSKIETILNLIQNIPNLTITIIDTFINSERLNDFMEKFLIGKINICDIEKYLIPSMNIRKKGILTSITNFCQKILFNNNTMNIYDFKPLTPADINWEKNIFDDINIKNSEIKTKIKVSLNETYFMDSLERFQSTLLRVICEGNKYPKVPSWWISFEEGTLIDFKKQFEKKDLRSLSHNIIKKSIKIVKNILLSSNYEETCSWCNTRIVEILNSQLSLHRIWSEVLCKFRKINVSELREIMEKKLYWKKTIGMIENYDFLMKKNDIENFMIAIQDSLNYITDIILDYQDPTGDTKFGKCLNDTVDGIINFSPGIYMKILIGSLDGLKQNIKIIENNNNHNILLNYTRMAEKFIPIWKPLQDIVKKSNINETEKFLPNATLNVNLLFSDVNNSLCKKLSDCKNLTIFNNYLNSKKSQKLLNYNATLSNYPENLIISKFLIDNLDFELINRKIISWRSNESWNLSWLQQILEHLMVTLEESGNLLEIASKIDFQDVSHVLGVPDVADGVIHLVKDKTIDKLFLALNDIVEDVEPFLQNLQIIHDLHSIVNAFESMEIFKCINN